jgi:hypothetical protein
MMLHNHIECGKHFGRRRGCEDTSRPVGTGIAAVYVRCRLLPAEHAARRIDFVQRYFTVLIS